MPGDRTLGSGAPSYFDVTVPTTAATLRSLLEAHGLWPSENAQVLAVDIVTMAGDIHIGSTATMIADGEYETLAAIDVPHKGEDLGSLDQYVAQASGTVAIVCKVHWASPRHSFTVTEN